MRGNMVLADHGLTTRESHPALRPSAEHAPIAATALIRAADPADAAGFRSIRSSHGSHCHGTPRLERRISATRNPRFPCSLCFRPESICGRQYRICWKALRSILPSWPRSTTINARSCASATMSMARASPGRHRSRRPTGSVTGSPAMSVQRRSPMSRPILRSPASPWCATRCRHAMARIPRPSQRCSNGRRRRSAAIQFRAVTEADYTRTAQLMPQVLSAVASFRWTGSWYTVFIGILPSDPADLINEAKGVMRLAPALAQEVTDFLERYRLAGYDLEIRPPQFLALEIDLLVCAASDHFRSDVAASGRSRARATDSSPMAAPAFSTRASSCSGSRSTSARSTQPCSV